MLSGVSGFGSGSAVQRPNQHSRIQRELKDLGLESTGSVTGDILAIREAHGEDGAQGIGASGKSDKADKKGPPKGPPKRPHGPGGPGGKPPKPQYETELNALNLNPTGSDTGDYNAIQKEVQQVVEAQGLTGLNLFSFSAVNFLA